MDFLGIALSILCTTLVGKIVGYGLYYLFPRARYRLVGMIEIFSSAVFLGFCVSLFIKSSYIAVICACAYSMIGIAGLLFRKHS